MVKKDWESRLPHTYVNGCGDECYYYTDGLRPAVPLPPSDNTGHIWCHHVGLRGKRGITIKSTKPPDKQGSWYICRSGELGLQFRIRSGRKWSIISPNDIRPRFNTKILHDIGNRQSP